MDADNVEDVVVTSAAVYDDGGTMVSVTNSASGSFGGNLVQAAVINGLTINTSNH